MKDPYQSLGVNKNATEAEVKKAYRKLAKEYHPDKSSGNEERFKEIADAYETLSDPKKKAQYDQRASNPFGSGPFDDSFFEDFIRTGGYNNPGFGGGFRGHHGFSTRGGNVDSKIYITLYDAYYGCVKEIRLGTRTINVDIRPGVKNGQRMRLKGLGQRGMTEEQNGDLILTILIQDDPNFYLDKKGLHTIRHIDMYEALLGGKGTIDVFDKKITYTIPKCVRNGTMLRIKGKGFPSYNNPDLHGDFYINIFVDLPKALTEEQEKLIKKVKDLDGRV
jgi:curved DNA-binding protein